MNGMLVNCDQKPFGRTGTGRETGAGVTWAYIFMGTGMKTGTGMGTGMYSLLTPSSTSVDKKRQIPAINTFYCLYLWIVTQSKWQKVGLCKTMLYK